MKLVNVVFGFVIFSIVVSMMFAATGDILSQNDVSGADDFNKLAGEYESFTKQIDNKDSTARGIISQTQQKPSESEESDINALKGAISGGKLSTNFFINFQDIIHNATGDVNTGQSYIDNRIIGGILALIVIFVAFVVLHFIRGFKTET